MPFPWRPLLLGLAVTAACGPVTSGPVQVMAVDVVQTQNYAPTQVTLTTVRDLAALKGVAANLIGGARIVIDSNDPLFASNPNPSDEDLFNIFVKSKGADVRVNYLNRAGVYWPVDFHSWNLTTTYYNFERAYQYFDSIGVLDMSQFTSPTVYYFPEFITADTSADPVKDNALFFAPIKGFVLLPFDQFQDIPLPMNRGIIAHEYSHLIWSKRVYGGVAFPAVFTSPSWQGSAGLNTLKSLDEGLADYHGVSSLCLDGANDPQCNDTQFLRPSLGAELAAERDMSNPSRCLSDTLLDGIAGDASFTDTGRHYQVGTVFATALYQAGRKFSPAGIQAGLLRSYNDVSTLTPGMAQVLKTFIDHPEKFSGCTIVTVIVSHVPDPALKQELCNQFVDRLRLESVPPGCPPSTSGLGICSPPTTSSDEFSKCYPLN